MESNKQITRLIAVALMGVLAVLAITARTAKINKDRHNFYCCVQQEASR